MPVIYTNNASTTLSSGINDSVTTIPIASASGFPSIGGGEYYFATIANTNNTKIEVVKVTAGTTSLTVLRAQDNTTAQAFDSGDNFQVRVTAATLGAATVSDVNITGGAIAGAALTDDGVTYAKIQNVAADERILGRVSGADGVIEELTKAQVLTFANVEDGADVTDATNVTAAGALMDSECAGLAALKATTGTFLSADESKLDGIEASATADQSAGEILTLLEDGIDSVHYKDGSIDNAHIADDQVDSEHYAAASIDLEHMSSESVDEDNLYISNAGSNGQFLSKQSGNNGGLTWATVSSEDFIPDGSVMCFWQSGAPTGWTQVTTQNDKALRVVSGTGGGTGGDWAMTSGETTSSDGAHTHTGAAHTHTSAAHTHTGASHTHTGGSLAAGAHTLATGEMPAHTHSGGGNGSGQYQYGDRSTGFTGGSTGSTGGGGSHSHSLSGTSAATTPGAGGSTTPGATGSSGTGATSSSGAHTHTLAAPQYIDIIICSKDA